MYICVVDYGSRFKNDHPRIIFDRAEALKWKEETQSFENRAAADGFRGLNRTVVRMDGGDYGDGATAVIETPGSGAGTARVFEVTGVELVDEPVAPKNVWKGSSDGWDSWG